MTSALISVDNVSKCYPAYAGNFDRFLSWFGVNVRPKSEFWAVKDVTFSAYVGEAIALIGQNGAGKSTLLKLITGITRQTQGRITVNGRISSLLELGLGFNPEFTGRENILRSGGLLGMTNDQILERMPEMEDFSEIGDFFDQPLRVYSSGMQARLAFALATAMRPEVLIVDEILSVGDSYFQHKSFNRIRQFKEEGTVVILVTHAMEDVRAICDRVILLDCGKVLKDGQTDEVVDYYNALVATRESEDLHVEQKKHRGDWLYTRSGNKMAHIEDVSLLNDSGMPLKAINVGEKLVIKVTVAVLQDIENLVLGVLIRDRSGHVVWGTNTSHTGNVIAKAVQGSRLIYSIAFDSTLGEGSYGVCLAVHSGENHIDSNYDWIENVEVFDVVNTKHPLFIGTTYLASTINVEQGGTDEQL